MELEIAKKLKYGDKINIHYGDSIVLGRFESLSKNGYIYYSASYSPSGQKARRSIVELHFDTKARLSREEADERKDG